MRRRARRLRLPRTTPLQLVQIEVDRWRGRRHDDLQRRGWRAPAVVTSMKAVEYLLQTLASNNVEVIFGNPGTTEIPLVRACEQTGAIRYVVALSEDRKSVG